ncbi:MAG TPA: hypothetical protein VGN74_05555 [Brevundimonas sp.]|jgi:hypothetical protein|uniref:hypothetical protein n=1 Tax=Brevundimonas sp. TaxID=1871086 RepID=UPI002E12A3D9|nr:hypothetical protein [Brevundimonas sp.]
MAGRPLAQARAQAALERIREANTTPTERRATPVTYTPDLCDEAIQLAAIGMTFVELADHWALSEEGLAEMAKAHADLQTALQRARTTAKAWWTRQPRLAIGEKDNKFPAGAWSQQVRALFPEYDDKASVMINVGNADRLVIVTRRDPYGEQLTGGQSPCEAKVLIEGETSRLDTGPEASGRPAGGFIAGPDGDQ